MSDGQLTGRARKHVRFVEKKEKKALKYGRSVGRSVGPLIR